MGLFFTDSFTCLFENILKIPTNKFLPNFLIVMLCNFITFRFHEYFVNSSRNLLTICVIFILNCLITFGLFGGFPSEHHRECTDK